MYSRDAIYYDALNQFLQSEDIAFYRQVIPTEAKHLCEVACGTGRILLSLKKAGRKLTGIDLSEDMLRIARQKSAMQGVAADWILADMCCLPDMDPVDVMICGYNSMQHICEPEKAQVFLQSAKAQLAPGGILIIDVFNPNPMFLFPEGNRRELARFRTAENTEVCVVEETRYYPDMLINEIVYHYALDGNYTFSETYTMKQYEPEVLDALIAHAGLRIMRKIGSYDGEGFIPSAPKQIYILEKCG